MWQIALAALAVGTAMSIAGADQEARQEGIRQDELKRQAEENKLMAKLKGEQLATQRSRVYTNFLKDTSAIAGFNRRGDDRSLKAVQKAGKERTIEELSTVRLQSLLAQSRSASRMAYADFEKQSAQDAALMSQVSTLAGNTYKAAMIMDSK